MSTQIRKMSALLAFALCAAAAVPARAQEETAFPQEIAAPEATIVIYQPQPETLKGNVLTGRAAMSIVPKGKTEPIFGALWFTSVIDTDEEAGTVRLRDIEVTNARWPDSKEEDEKRFTEIVAEATTGITMTSERLSASLESAEREKKSLAELKNDPPALVFEKELAVLLLYDGSRCGPTSSRAPTSAPSTRPTWSCARSGRRPAGSAAGSSGTRRRIRSRAGSPRRARPPTS
jgi:hypothetical protein